MFLVNRKGNDGFCVCMEKDEILNILYNTIIKLFKNAYSMFLHTIQYCFHSRIA